VGVVGSKQRGTQKICLTPKFTLKQAAENLAVAESIIRLARLASMAAIVSSAGKSHLAALSVVAVAGRRGSSAMTNCDIKQELAGEPMMVL
jgi:hypothetical protein